MDSSIWICSLWGWTKQLGLLPGSSGLLTSTQAWGSMNFFPFIHCIMPPLHHLFRFSVSYIWKQQKDFICFSCLFSAFVFVSLFKNYKIQKDFRLHFWASCDCRFLHNSFRHFIFHLFSVAQFELKFSQQFETFHPLLTKKLAMSFEAWKYFWNFELSSRSYCWQIFHPYSICNCEQFQLGEEEQRWKNHCNYW